MGHANLSNLSRIVVRQVYARGKASINDFVTFALKHGETVHASEGEYEDEGMLRMMFMELVNFYLKEHRPDNVKPASAVLRPFAMTERQREVYEQFEEDGEAFEAWDGNEENPDAEYNVFDTIKWQFRPGWRKEYPNVPILANYTN